MKNISSKLSKKKKGCVECDVKQSGPSLINDIFKTLSPPSRFNDFKFSLNNQPESNKLFNARIFHIRYFNSEEIKLFSIKYKNINTK